MKITPFDVGVGAAWAVDASQKKQGSQPQQGLGLWGWLFLLTVVPVMLFGFVMIVAGILVLL